jgi:hypothetical protein
MSLTHDTQRDFRNIDSRLDTVELSVVRGTGAPSSTPTGPQLYLREDGAAGSAVYAYQPGTGWLALA